MDPSHDPRDGHRPFPVVDHQHLPVKRTFDTVERLHAGAFPCAPDHDPPPAQAVEIERVERVPRFEQHVVGDIDDIVERSHPRRFQPPPHPLRGFPHRDPVEHKADVPRTEIGVTDLDPERDRFGSGLEFLLHGRELERAIVARGHFPGDADVAETVGPVGGHLDVEDGPSGRRLHPFHQQPDHRQVLLERLHAFGD